MRILLIIFLSSFLIADEKLLIISHHFAQPIFVEMQVKSFKKFIQDEYEFVVFNDANTAEIAQEIDVFCRINNIRCIRVEQSIHDRPYLPRFPGEDNNHPCIRCANVVQYSLDVLGFEHEGPVVIIDSDMFLIKPISFLNYLKDYALVAVPQSRSCYGEDPVVNYIWNGIVMFNMPCLPERRAINFNCGQVEGVATDVGGYMHYYLLKYKDSLSIRYIESEPFYDSVISYQNGKLHPTFHVLIPLIESGVSTNMETFLDATVLHYRGGGKWEGLKPEFYENKNKLVQKFINDLLNY
jgi:hypothetical protein